MILGDLVALFAQNDPGAAPFGTRLYGIPSPSSICMRHVLTRLYADVLQQPSYVLG